MIDSKRLPPHWRQHPELMAARLDSHRDQIMKIHTDITEIKSLLQRGGLLVALWGSSLLLLLASDEKAKTIADLIKSIIGRG